MHCCAQESARATLASRSTLTCLVRSSFHPRDPVKGSRASAVARSPCPARPKPDVARWPRDTLGRRQQPTQIDFFKDEHPRLVPLSMRGRSVSFACMDDACGSRRLHRFGGPDLGSGCPCEHPAYDSSRSLDTDVIFPCRPSGTDPLTTRHPAASRPPRLERTESTVET